MNTSYNVSINSSIHSCASQQMPQPTSSAAAVAAALTWAGKLTQLAEQGLDALLLARTLPLSSANSRSSSGCVAMASGKKDSINLLVVANPETPELSVLQKLPAGVNIVATGQTLSALSQQLTEEQWGSIDVMLNCGVGKNAGKRQDIQVCSSSGRSSSVDRPKVFCSDCTPRLAHAHTALHWSSGGVAADLPTGSAGCWARNQCM